MQRPEDVAEARRLVDAIGWAAVLPLLLATLGICLLIGAVVFQGYALVFASPVMVAAYRRARRAIEGVLAGVFGYAGWRLWSSA